MSPSEIIMLPCDFENLVACQHNYVASWSRKVTVACQHNLLQVEADK